MRQAYYEYTYPSSSDPFRAMATRGYVYILTNKPNGTLYVGVTSDPIERIRRHKEGRGSQFAAQYNLTRLVHIEEHDTMPAALRREKRLKRWQREWKLSLIREHNPTWEDRYEEVCRLLAGGGRLP